MLTGPLPRIAPAFAAADLSLCPIEFGGGTKIKLMEALAAGLPTVAFAESLRGTELRDGVHVVVAPKSVEGRLGALQRLANDPAEAARIVEEALAELVRR